MLIALVNGMLAPALHRRVWDTCMTSHWYFGHASVPGQSGVQAFWRMDLEAREGSVIGEMWAAARPQCEALINRPLRVVRVYANGHTYGLGGQTHSDDVDAGAYTLLYYPMLEWQSIWQGETVFHDQHGEIKSAIMPAPNRGVFFDARIPHAGRAPSRYFGGLRVTVAFKLKVSQGNEEPLVD